MTAEFELDFAHFHRKQIILSVEIVLYYFFIGKIINKISDNQTAEAFHDKLFHLSSIQNNNIELSYTGRDIFSDGGLLLQKEMQKHTQFVNSTVKTIQLKLLKRAAYVRNLENSGLIEECNYHLQFL